MPIPSSSGRSPAPRRRDKQRRLQTATRRRRMYAEVLEDRRVLAAIAWDGGGDGTTWNDPLNWDSNAVPSVNDDVTIPDTAAAEILVDPPGASVRSIQSDEFLRVEGNITLADPSVFSAGLVLGGGHIIDGSGDVTLGGNSGLGRDSSVSGTGSLTVLANVEVGADRARINRVVENLGRIRVVGNSATLSQNDWFNRGGGEVELNQDASLAFSGDAIFHNEGTIRRSGDGVSELDAPVNNTGVIEVQSGVLEIRGDLQNDADLHVPSGATLELTAAADFGDGNTIDGAGTFALTGTGPYDFSGNQFLPTGFVDLFGFNAPVTIDNTLPTAATFGNIRTSIEFGADQVLTGPAGFQSGTISGSGNITLAGEWTMNRSTFEGTGNLTISQGSRLRSFNSSTIDRDTDVFGELVRVSGTLGVQQDLEIHPTGTFEVAGGDPAFPNPAIRTQPTTTIRSFGTLKKTGAGEATVSSSGSVEATGPLMVSMGKLEINVPTQLLGPVDVTGELRLNGNTQTSAATSFSGPGILTFGTGPVEVSNAPINVGMLQLRGAATIGTTVTSTTLIDASNSQVTWNANQQFVSPTLIGSTFRGPVDLTFSGAVTSSDATLENEGGVAITAGSTWNAFGRTTFPETTNHGNLRFRGSTVELGQTFTNAPTGTLSFENAIDVGRFSSGSLVNEGLVSKISSERVRLLDQVVNRGAVRVEAGSLELQRDPATIGGTYQVDRGAELEANLNLDADSRLTGGGRVTGDVVNGGTVAPGDGMPFGAGTDTLNIQGAYTQTAEGVVLVGLANETLADRLEVSGLATLAGEVSVDYLAASPPAVGTSFEVLSSSSSVGALVLGSVSGLPVNLTFEVQAPSLDTVSLVVTSNDPGHGPEEARRSLNELFSSQDGLISDYASNFRSQVSGLPFLSEAAGTFDELLGIAGAIGDELFSLIQPIQTAVTRFEELAEQAEQVGYLVRRLKGEPGTDPIDLIELRFAPQPTRLTLSVGDPSLEGSVLDNLPSQEGFSGATEISAELAADFGFGVDTSGPYVTADSGFRLSSQFRTQLAGQIELFAAGIDVETQLGTNLTLAQLDADGDGRIHPAELTGGARGLPIEQNKIQSTVTLDARLNFLDYVDVDPSLPNTSGGGDPFLIRAQSRTVARPSEVDAETFAGIRASEGPLRALNPDVNQDGQPDYTNVVFIKNVLHLSEDLLNGNGVLDYFRNVLGVDGIESPGTPVSPGNELQAGGKIPLRPLPLPDQVAARQAIANVVAEAAAVSGSPTPEQEADFSRRIRGAIGDWLAHERSDLEANAQGDVPESVAYRVAKIAPDHANGLVGADAATLPTFPQTPQGDADFEQALIDAISDYLSWHAELSALGISPEPLLRPNPQSPQTQGNDGNEQLRRIEDAMVAGLGEVVDRSLRRAESRIGADAATADIDRLTEDAADAFGWSAEAARLSTLVPLTPGESSGASFDQRANIRVDQIIERLPFRFAIEETDFVADPGADSGVLNVVAGIELKNPAGGFFDPVAHESVVVQVSGAPQRDAEGTVDLGIPANTDPEIAVRSGPVDSTGRFSTPVSMGVNDRDIHLRVSVGALGDAQAIVLHEGSVGVELSGRVAVVAQSSDEDGLNEIVLAPSGYDVELTALVTRGNGVLANRGVHFFTAPGDQGLIRFAASKTDADGRTVAYFTPPIDGSAGTSTVNLAYFDDGQLYRDAITIQYGPIDDLLLESVPTGSIDFANLPASAEEESVRARADLLLAGFEEPVSLAEIDEDSRAAQIGFLKGMFENVVLPNLNAGQDDDDGAKRGLRDYLGWQNLLAEHQVDPLDVISQSELESAESALLSLTQRAVARQQALFANADSIDPLINALQWPLAAEFLGLDAESAGLSSAAVAAQFGIQVEIQNVSLAGPINDAQLSGEIIVQIDGVRPDFEIPVSVALDAQGSGVLGDTEFTLDRDGTFSSTARLGANRDRLTVSAHASLAGVRLASLTTSRFARPRIEIATFAGDNAAEAIAGRVIIDAGDLAGIQVDVFRGDVPLRDAEVIVTVTGGGHVDSESFSSGASGSGSVSFFPPISDQAGTSVVSITLNDPLTGPVTENAVITYNRAAPTDVFRGQTQDAILAAARVRLLNDQFAADEEGNPIPSADYQDAIRAVLRDWFLGFESNPEALSVLQRLNLDPDPVSNLAAYRQRRDGVAASIRNYFHWQSAVLASSTDDLTNIFSDSQTGQQLIDRAQERMKSLVEGELRQLSALGESADTDIGSITILSREMTSWLADALSLGIDIDIDQALRRSLAFPTEAMTSALNGIEVLLGQKDATSVESQALVIRPDVLADLGRLLRDWLLLENENAPSIHDQLQVLREGSDSEIDDISDRIRFTKKATRDLLIWKQTLSQYGLETDQVLTAEDLDANRFREVEQLAASSLRETIARIRIAVTSSVQALPNNPGRSDLEAVFNLAAQAVTLTETARRLDLAQPGSGLTESEVVPALGFAIEIVPGTLALPESENSTSRDLSLQAGIRLDGAADLLFSDLVDVEVAPLGQNSVANPAGTTDSTGTYETRVTLGPGETHFEYQVNVRYRGLTFESQFIKVAAPTRLDVTAALSRVGNANFSGAPATALDGENVRLRVRLGQGNGTVAGAPVFLTQVGEGLLSTEVSRTSGDGSFEFLWTPPSDKIGRTQIFATFFSPRGVVQSSLIVAYTSSQADATVVAEVSAEQATAVAIANPLIQRAALELISGNDPTAFLAPIANAFETWFTTGIRPRLASAESDWEALQFVTREYLSFAAESQTLGLGSRLDGQPDSETLEDELLLGQNELAQAFRDLIDNSSSTAIAQRTGNVALNALRASLLAAELGLLAETGDERYAPERLRDRMQLRVVIENAQLQPEENEANSFNLVVSARLEIQSAVAGDTTTVPVIDPLSDLDVRIIGFGRSTVGVPNGKLNSEGEYQTPVSLGQGDTSLRARVEVGNGLLSASTDVIASTQVAISSVFGRRGQPAIRDGGQSVSLGAEQQLIVIAQAAQGRGVIVDPNFQFQLLDANGNPGAGRLEIQPAGSATDFRQVEFIPPETGSGSTILRTALPTGDGVSFEELTIIWDNDAAAVPPQPQDELLEAAGLFSAAGSVEQLGSADVAGTSLQQGLRLNEARFELPIEEICVLLEGHGNLASWQDGSLDLLQIIDFEELVGFFADGLPEAPAELIRLRLDVDNTEHENDALLDADLSDLLPEGVNAELSLDSPEFVGSLVFGLDTSASPFYLLTVGDEISEPTSDITVDFGLAGRLHSDEPILGTPEEPILSITSGTLAIETGVSIDFSKVSADDGKLRFDELDELGRLRVRFEQGDPIGSLQSIITTELSIPGLKAASESDDDAVIGLVGAASKPAPGEETTFELRVGEFPSLPPEVAERLSTLTPSIDDFYEPNNAAEQVRDAAVSTSENPTANLGIIDGLVRLAAVENGEGIVTRMTLQDEADWFRFETTNEGTSLDFVRLDFDGERGDLDLRLFREDGGELIEVGRDELARGDFAQVSLLDQPAGVFFAQVFEDGGTSQPHYAITIQPNATTTSGIDLSFGAVDLRDVNFVGRIDTAGDFTVAIDGDLVFPDVKIGEGDNPLKIGASALVDNNQFTLSGTLDLTGQEVGIGAADNRLLAIDGFIGTVDLTIPFDGGPVRGGLLIEADSAMLSPGLGIEAAVDGTQADPGLTGSLDFATGRIDFDLQNFRADFAGIITVNAMSNGAQPAVAFSFDPAADRSDPVLTFASLSAKLPAISNSLEGTLTDFGFRHDGSVFLGGVSFSGIGEALAEFGIPDFISVRELGLESTGGGPLTSEQIVSLQFRLTASAGIDLNDFGVPLVADVDDLSIAADALNGGNLLSSIEFGSVSVAISPPIDVGPLSVGGGFMLEPFDPNEENTPADERQPNSLLVRVFADVEFAGIELSGDF